MIDSAQETRAPVIRHFVLRTARRILEGDHRWGTIDSSPISRSAIAHHRVTVFAPGANSAERLLLHLNRNWPVIGSIGMLVALVSLEPVIPAGVLIAGIASCYVAGIVILARRTRSLRASSRRASAVLIARASGVESHGDPQLVAATIARFAELDAQFAAGLLTPAQYEHGWAVVYGALEQPVEASWQTAPRV